MARIMVSDVSVDVIFRSIKNLHVGVYPPDGHVRVSAPERMSVDAVRLAVVSRLAWIRRQQQRYANKARQTKRKYVSRESHFYLGQRYLLKVVEHAKANHIEIRGKRTMRMELWGTPPRERRDAIMSAWYRQRLREVLAPMIEKWEVILDVQVVDWRVRAMKTRWGSCSKAGRLWFNTELAKKPVVCIEYIVVHEMAHLLERRHNQRFVALLDQHLPTWRQRRDELNQLPLKEEAW